MLVPGGEQPARYGRYGFRQTEGDPEPKSHRLRLFNVQAIEQDFPSRLRELCGVSSSGAIIGVDSAVSVRQGFRIAIRKLTLRFLSRQDGHLLSLTSLK